MMRLTMWTRTCATALSGLLMFGCQSLNAGTLDVQPNTLSAIEQQAGWQLLFDGKDFNQWTGLGREDIPSQHWVIADGTLHKVASGKVALAPDGQPIGGGDLMTKKTFRNFVLDFDWKISPAGNSGVKYNVSEELSVKTPPASAALGFEYQVLDDARHEDGKNPTHRTGALYDLIAPDAQKDVKPVGEWNHSRIVFVGNHGEHWLNGKKVVEYDLATPEFDARVAASKYATVDGFATRRAGHIVLQDHTDDAWYRDLKILVLPDDATAEMARKLLQP